MSIYRFHVHDLSNMWQISNSSTSPQQLAYYNCKQSSHPWNPAVKQILCSIYWSAQYKSQNSYNRVQLTTDHKVNVQVSQPDFMGGCFVYSCNMPAAVERLRSLKFVTCLTGHTHGIYIWTCFWILISHCACFFPNFGTGSHSVSCSLYTLVCSDVALSQSCSSSHWVCPITVK